MPAAYPPSFEPQSRSYAPAPDDSNPTAAYAPGEIYEGDGRWSTTTGTDFPGRDRRGASDSRPRDPRPRWSVATLLAAILTLVASGLIGWSVYTWLASFKVIDVILGRADVVTQSVRWAFGAGALLAFVAVVLAIVGIGRSRARLIPALMLIVALFLPAGALVGAAAQGGPAWVDQTMAQLDTYGSQLSADQLNSLYDTVSTVASRVPGSQEVLDKLDQLRGQVPGLPDPSAPAGGAQTAGAGEPAASATP